jgi:hypothetical protein
MIISFYNRSVRSSRVYIIIGCAISNARKIIYKGKYWYMLFAAPFRLLARILLVLKPFLI